MSSNGAENVFSRLSSNQRAVLKALLDGADRDQAASSAGVSRRTVDRYHNDPDFIAALNQATGRELSNLARLMVGDMKAARAVLRELCEDRRASWGLRIRAATALLRYGRELHDESIILQRIEALEAKL